MGTQNVGRNKPARRLQERVFPASRCAEMPETPVLRLRRGPAYSGLRRNVRHDGAWELLRE
ncbi:MAG: hypothetical protein M0R47_12975 [Methylobacter sp.]|uniref:hypothetical protein n=1 Tax=Methylobacter sp. TaxID=2051955 RepID=UPI0025DABCE2|nr:hypothetical protein [Methylobacter sp.]MCK9621434.1 hypothetical protein [Methylobacter sp.]